MPFRDWYTIIPTPPTAWAKERRPSETFMVMERPTIDVSEESRLINSPVFLLSKKAISCFVMEENSFSRRFLTIILAETKKKKANG